MCWIFPEYTKYIEGSGVYPQIDPPSCTDKIYLMREDIVHRNSSNLSQALQKVNRSPEQSFVNVPSPGLVASLLKNGYYKSYDKYLEALAIALRDEYSIIASYGFNLQIDCPDLAMGKHVFFPDKKISEFKKIISKHVEVLNHILEDIDPSRCRIHVCWGNYPGPHHYDISFSEVVDIIFSCSAQMILFEAANPRHAHEFEELQSIKIPDDKILAPGVIDVKTNYIEHPQLIKQRIMNYINLVGHDRVIASTDCGFSSFSGCCHVSKDIVWAKLKNLIIGSQLV